MRRHLITTRP
jgi:lysosomal alpha-mannosidase